MRFPMIKIINCLKYAQQCQNGISMKTCKTTTVPYSVISPRHYVNTGSMGNSLILYCMYLTPKNTLCGSFTQSLSLKIGM